MTTAPTLGMLVSLISRCTFFFSSRRRHTRCSRDWSSDVCSSDLFDVASDASEEQPDADDDAEEHAAANDLATPRAPETLDGCGLIQGHVHGHRCYGPSISQVSPRRATARRGDSAGGGGRRRAGPTGP